MELFSEVLLKGLHVSTIKVNSLDDIHARVNILLASHVTCGTSVVGYYSDAAILVI